MLLGSGLFCLFKTSSVLGLDSVDPLMPIFLKNKPSEGVRGQPFESLLRG